MDVLTDVIEIILNIKEECINHLYVTVESIIVS